MAIPYRSSIDLGGNELQNAVIQNLAAPPGSPKLGQQYYDTVKGALGVYNGTRWVYATDEVPDITGKADKVSGATSGHLAALDASGNLQDAGVSAAELIPASQKGAANGVATLDDAGMVPAAQLPSYVDDVLELLTVGATAPGTAAAGDMYYNTASKLLHTYTTAWGTGATPASGKIYVAMDTNITYRWGGTDMVEISKSLAIGTTPTTASAGNRGLPSGGTAGQVLTKTDGTDYNVGWATPAQAIGTYKETNPALTPSGGAASWTVTHNRNNDVMCRIKEAATNKEVIAEVTYTSANVLTVTIAASATIAAGTYQILVIG